MKRILLAEDTECARAALTLILESAGYVADSVADGDAAVELFQANGYDLAVVDIWLPKRSGLDVLKAIRLAEPDFPVVLISGGGPGATLEQASLMADLYWADRILYKPFDDAELLNAISDLLQPTTSS
jgi:two-component system, chemotaxis family, chemotaxis protein CheY